MQLTSGLSEKDKNKLMHDLTNYGNGLVHIYQDTDGHIVTSRIPLTEVVYNNDFELLKSHLRRKQTGKKPAK